MSRYLLRRTRRGSPPTAQADGQHYASLDWELGEVLPADVIEIAPLRHSEEWRIPAHAARPATTVNGRSATPLVEAFSGTHSVGRLTTLIDALDQALDRWWSENQLPPTPLLRDALLALEAGHKLDEGHRTLLLRSTLKVRKGLLTALRHQTDPERTAFLLKEELLNVWQPLPPDWLWRLKREDPNSKAWAPLLTRELRDELVAVRGIQRQLAERGLAALAGERVAAEAIFEAGRPGLALRPLAPGGGRVYHVRYWSPGRTVLLILALAGLAALLLGPKPNVTPALVNFPAGEYRVGPVTNDQKPRAVTLAPFELDRTEVTNANYGQCVTVGRCPAPDSPASATRPTYFDDPQYEYYPVVNVTWQAAGQFCDWLGKRLPSAEEWEVAASFSPATKRQFRYPWGDLYEAQLVNAGPAAQAETQPVATFQPFGNSPSGLADMAGNVAEWTASTAGTAEDQRIVKGGSYLDGPDAVQVSAEQLAVPFEGKPWLGFRCAADQPGSETVKQ